jgi:F-type H+-transporting ATPase subunit b
MTGRIIEKMAAEANNPLLPATADLIWSSVVFAILLVVFWRRVLPAFKKNLDARTEAIEGRLAEAEKAQAAAAAKTANIETEQAEARAEAAQIRESARAEGAAILAELKEQASLEAARMTETAKKQIEAERQAAIISLRAEVGSLAIDLASSVVKNNLKEDKSASAIVDGFLADLEKEGK